MNVRQMRAEDVGQMVRIADTLDEAPRWAPAHYSRALDPDAAPPRIALVAEDPGGGVTGFVMTVLIPPQAELETIAVAKAFRRQGIARRLMTELIAELKERQILEVMLEVRESNHPARALYAALGFTQTGRRKGYYSGPVEDAILLRRLLA